MRTLTLSLIIAVCLSACGFKGPLYLPAKPAAKPAPTQAAPAPVPVQPHSDASQP
ncbi:lipoprotein [Paludibacterium sp. THUN1379]|uniref:LPS translocon maturation chaperone LptM n=1 Tax=unclassified Paludibacterium TaxID=2618429 RepID=UPI0030D4FE1C